MYPRSTNLLGLNINRGAKICLRLRDAARPDAFLEHAEIVRTYVAARSRSMLHELAHNVRGPHDTQFYTTLTQLTDEYDAAQRLGYWPGDGFLTPGTRLGGAPVPATLAVRRAKVVPPPVSPDEFLRHMAVDKKNIDGRLRLVLLRQLGRAVVTDEADRGRLVATLMAGEHISYLPAWMEGAILSALDAVQRLHTSVTEA